MMIVDGNKFIEFKLLSDTGKTQSWSVVNKSYGGYPLGQICWYSGWRKYVFQPNTDTEYESTCLKTITEFLVRLDKEKRIIGASQVKML